MARSRSSPAAAALAAALVVAAPAEGAAVAEATCATGMAGAAETVRAADVVLGPLVLIGGRGWGRSRRDAFDGHGFKIPATLLADRAATLSVPPALRGRVGFVFTRRAARAVERRGVGAADEAVRFTACAGAPSDRTGWAGGIVVDRPRCATVVVRVAGADPIRRRLPLGRRC